MKLLAAALIGAGLCGSAASVHAAEERLPVMQPRGEKVEFAPIQEQCVQFADVRFGPGQRWDGCHVTRAGFVSTIELLDFYYAHYCLTKTAAKTAAKAAAKPATTPPTKAADRRTSADPAPACDKRALVIFGNRAYRHDAFAVLHRIDPAGTEYGVPLVTGADDDNLLAISVKRRGAALARHLFAWKEDFWQRMDDRAWKSALRKHLPAGARIGADTVIDPETLTVMVPMAGSAGSLRVEMGYADGRLFVRHPTRHRAKPTAAAAGAH